MLWGLQSKVPLGATWQAYPSLSPPSQPISEQLLALSVADGSQEQV